MDNETLFLVFAMINQQFDNCRLDNGDNTG